MTEDDAAERRREQVRASQARRRAGAPKLRQPAQCGTKSGANAHRRKGEPVCDACKVAEREAKRASYKPSERPPGRPPKTES